MLKVTAWISLSRLPVSGHVCPIGFHKEKRQVYLTRLVPVTVTFGSPPLLDMLLGVAGMISSRLFSISFQDRARSAPTLIPIKASMVTLHRFLYAPARNRANSETKIFKSTKSVSHG